MYFKALISLHRGSGADSEEGSGTVRDDACCLDECLCWVCPLHMEAQLCALQLVGLDSAADLLSVYRKLRLCKPEIDAACRAFRGGGLTHQNQSTRAELNRTSELGEEKEKKQSVVKCD